MTDADKKAQAAPVTASPPPLIPDRKVWGAGLAGVASAVLLSLLHRYTGFDLQPTLNSLFALIGTPAPDAQLTLAGIISWAVAYYLPPAQRDIVKRLNDEIVAIAARDPASPVSPRTVTVITPKDLTP